MQIDSGISDETYQDQILPHVSRTFALTIPQLPPALRTPVTSAYLLCRIADTIEDEPGISAAETYGFLQRFTAVVCGREEAAALAGEIVRRFSEQTLAKWAVTGKGPKFSKLGRGRSARVRYLIADLDAFLNGGRAA